jgi:hypothetical protein
VDLRGRAPTKTTPPASLSAASAHHDPPGRSRTLALSLAGEPRKVSAPAGARGVRDPETACPFRLRFTVLEVQR